MEIVRGICSDCQTIWGLVNLNTPIVPILMPGALDGFDEAPIYLLEQHRIPGAPRFCDGSGQQPETLSV